jgi:NAD(P)-dependent dehydrogenase (short-subunit alcohol dehydrogenase family)
VSVVPTAIITGAGGLIGSEAVGHFIGEGFDVVGIENDMRASFFGPEASTAHVTERLVAVHPEFRSENADIRDRDAVERIFAEHGGKIELVIHTAAQPSHDWAASDPQTDFGVNANGTLNLRGRFCIEHVVARHGSSDTQRACAALPGTHRPNFQSAGAGVGPAAWRRRPRRQLRDAAAGSPRKRAAPRSM